MNSTIRKCLLIVFYFAFVAVSGVRTEDLHPIQAKSRQCFDTYQDHSTLFLQTLDKTCVKSLPSYKSCVGLQSESEETVIVKCRTKMAKFQQLDTGCYRYIAKNKTEGIICQKFDKGRGCEVINLPSGKNIDVFCAPLKPEGVIILRPTTVAADKA